MFIYYISNTSDRHWQFGAHSMVEDTSVGLILLASSIAFFSFKIHSDAVNFDIKYRQELDQIKRRLSAKFRKKAEDLVLLIVTKGTNKLDKSISSIEEIHENTNMIDLPDKINELSLILSDIEKIKNNFKKIRELKRKMETRLFIIAFIVGINAILPFLGSPTIAMSPTATPNQTTAGYLIIFMIDFFGIFPVLDIISAYRENSRKEEEFMRKLDEEEVETGELISTSKSED